jgi:hypothetical protein
MLESAEKRVDCRAQLVESLAYLSAVLAVAKKPDKAAAPPNPWHNPLDLTELDYRDGYQQGRINEADLAAAFSHAPHLQADRSLCTAADKPITRQAIYRMALLFDLSPINISQFAWQASALSAFDNRTATGALWAIIADKLELPASALHPETLPELTVTQAEAALAHNPHLPDETLHEQVRQRASAELDRLFSALGDNTSLCSLVQALSGVDVLDSIRPLLQRVHTALFNAERTAWTTPAHRQPDHYARWRTLARRDASLFLHRLPDWQNIMAELPDDALSAIALQLRKLGIPSTQWTAYLQQLVLEMPEQTVFIGGHPHYPPAYETSSALADYLAIRLTLDRLWLNQVCHDLWKIEAKVSALQAYFHKNLSEFWIRRQLYQGDLPEFLAQHAQTLIVRTGSERQDRTDWRHLADLILRWQNRGAAHTDISNGWRLLSLCQHLGLDTMHLQALGKADLQAMLAVLDGFNAPERRQIWRYAAAHHGGQTTPRVAASAQPPDLPARPHWFLHTSPWFAYPLVYAAAPAVLVNLLIKTLSPVLHHRLLVMLGRIISR